MLLPELRVIIRNFLGQLSRARFAMTCHLFLNEDPGPWLQPGWERVVKDKRMEMKSIMDSRLLCYPAPSMWNLPTATLSITRFCWCVSLQRKVFIDVNLPNEWILSVRESDTVATRDVAKGKEFYSIESLFREFDLRGDLRWFYRK